MNYYSKCLIVTSVYAKHLSMNIYEGQITTILGENGAGKVGSILLRILILKSVVNGCLLKIRFYFGIFEL